MQEFLTNLNSIYWWISVVIVGMLLNIFSSYFRDIIDKIFSYFSKWWSNRTKAKKEERKRQIEKMVGNREAQQQMITSEFRNRLRAIHTFGFVFWF